MNTSFLKLKYQVLLHALAAAVLIELISLIFYGYDTRFLLGLLAGTGTTVLNYRSLERSVLAVMDKNSRVRAVTGYFLRLPVYGLVFYLCLRAGAPSAVGCVLGFLTLQFALLYLFGIRSLFPGAPKNPLNDWTEPRQWRDPSEWEDGEDEDDDWGPLPKWPDNKKH
jgi:hypothetical protein